MPGEDEQVSSFDQTDGVVCTCRCLCDNGCCGGRHTSFVPCSWCKTAIIGEDGSVEWGYKDGSRDGFVLPNGNVLIAFADRVEEVTRNGQQVFLWKLSAPNGEISTAQRLYNGNTLVTELGPKPRLLEISPDGTMAHEVTLLPETDNVHMQTRMARQLRNGNYLVPHLLAFALKEYSPEVQL